MEKRIGAMQKVGVRGQESRGWGLQRVVKGQRSEDKDLDVKEASEGRCWSGRQDTWSWRVKVPHDWHSKSDKVQSAKLEDVRCILVVMVV